MIWLFSVFFVAIAIVGFGVANKVFPVAVKANLLKAEHDNTINDGVLQHVLKVS